MGNKWLHSVREKNILEIGLVRDGKHLTSEFSPNHCAFFTRLAKNISEVSKYDKGEKNSLRRRNLF